MGVTKFSDVVRMAWREPTADERQFVEDCGQHALGQEALVMDVSEDYLWVLDGDRLAIFGPEGDTYKDYQISWTCRRMT